MREKREVKVKDKKPIKLLRKPLQSVEDYLKADYEEAMRLMPENNLSEEDIEKIWQGVKNDPYMKAIIKKEMDLEMLCDLEKEDRRFSDEYN